VNYSVGHLFCGVGLILRLFGRIGGSILHVGLLLRFWRLIVVMICRCLLTRRGFLGLCCLVFFVGYVFGEGGGILPTAWVETIVYVAFCC